MPRNGARNCGPRPLAAAVNSLIFAGVLFELNKSDIQTSYTEDMQETRRPPAAMMPLRVGWLILCYLLLASPLGANAPADLRAVMAAKNQPFVRFQEP